MRSCDRIERRVCTEKREDVSIERREKRGIWVHKWIIEKRLYQALKVTSNSTSIFCRKEGWKKEDNIRLSISQIVKNNYPLLLILDIIKNIVTKKIFTKMNLKWGYNNIKIKERDKWKTAFMTPERSFESTVMFFGLANLPATFQTMMNELLRNLINTRKVRSFIDDIIIGTEMKKGYNELVEEILRRLKENDLYVKLEKYKWKVKEVNFLKVVLGPEEIKIEKAKVKVVLNWPVYKSVKDIQKFLELANYYWIFIKRFAKIVRPLYELTRKKQKWNWEIRQEKTFKVLKKQFTTKPILVAPDLDKKMRVEVDALDYTTEDVLSIECKDRKWRPVAYLSKSLNETERIYDKEILTVIRKLEN